MQNLLICWQFGCGLKTVGVRRC